MDIIPTEIEPIDLLFEIRKVIKRFVVLAEGEDLILALWPLGTHLVRPYDQSQAFDFYPILRATSPDKESGKSTLRKVLVQLCANPKETMNISTANLYRLIERKQRTLLIDEFDSMMAKGGEFSTDMTNLLNSGCEQSGIVDRCVGNDHEPKEFHTWSAKAIFGIGDITDTTASRCITIVLMKKLPSEHVDRLADVLRTESVWFDQLKQAIAHFIDENEIDITTGMSSVPPELGNRAYDRWEPLFRLAEVFGKDVVRELSETAVRLELETDDPPSPELNVLVCTKEFWDNHQGDRASSKSICEFINRLQEDMVIPTHLGRMERLTQRVLARILRLFGIRPEQLGDGSNQRGYFRANFKDAFNRYLCPAS